MVQEVLLPHEIEWLVSQQHRPIAATQVKSFTSHPNPAQQPDLNPPQSITCNLVLPHEAHLLSEGLSLRWALQCIMQDIMSDKIWTTEVSTDYI